MTNSTPKKTTKHKGERGNEFEKLYGKSEEKTDCIGLGEWKRNDLIKFKDGKTRQLIHIEYRNMAIDLLRFDDGLEIFTEDIKNYFYL